MFVKEIIFHMHGYFNFLVQVDVALLRLRGTSLINNSSGNSNMILLTIRIIAQNKEIFFNHKSTTFYSENNSDYTLPGRTTHKKK